MSELARRDAQGVEPNDADRIDERLDVIDQAIAETSEIEEAEELRRYSSALREAIKRAKGDSHTAWRGGVTSVNAARKVGELLLSLDGKSCSTEIGRGRLPSKRRVVGESLGLSWHLARDLVRLAQASRADLDRYLNDATIPSVRGALLALGHPVRGGPHKKVRPTKRHKINGAQNPTLAEAYSLLRRAASQLSPLASKPGMARPSACSALAAVYAALDAILPHL